VVLSTGEFQLSATDMEIPGRGFPFRLTRTYRSRKDGEKSVLGYNWYLNLDEYLTPGVFTSDGHTYPAIQWKLGNGFTDVWVSYPNETGYRPFQGFFGKLRPLGPGQGYQIRYPDGTIKTFGQQALNDDGHLIWMLTRVEDRGGNAMTLQISPAGVVSSVTDTLGRAILFTYTAQGRLATVTDFAGRSLVYSYDARGDLVAVRSPVVVGTPNGNDFPAGKTTSYRYLGAGGCTEEALRHNLQSITDARGQTFLVNAYISIADPLCGAPGLPADTVAFQEYGGSPAPRIQYAYEPVPAGAAPDANVVTTQATVQDRAGNVQIHRFNPQGNPLSIEYRTNRGIRSFTGGLDEPDYLVRNVYVVDHLGNQPMLVSRRTSAGGLAVGSTGSLIRYAEGVTEEYVYYDQQGLIANPDIFRKGNVERIIRTPGSRGAPAGQEQLVTELEYEPLFNQPVRIRDPRGHATRMTYDYQERAYADLVAGTPPAAVHPAWWSNSEVSSWMALPGNSILGDVNGDGAAAYSRRGSLLRSEEEGSILAADGSPSGVIAALNRYNSFGLPAVLVDAEGNETHFDYFPERDPDGDGANTPPPPDGRSLSAASGSSGGGYLRSQVLDATPSPPRTEPAPANVTLAFTYDRVGNISTSTDGRGIRTDFSVNALNQIVQIRRAAAAPAGLTAFGYLEQLEFDANNNVSRRRIEQRDDLAQAPGQDRWITTEYAYDALDRKTRETVTTSDAVPLTIATRFEYDANGNLAKTVLPAGNVVLRRYDERDLLFQEAALKVCVEPGPTSSVCNSFDPAIDSVTQLDYDGSGGIIQVKDPEGHVARSAHDGYGRKVAVFDAAYQKTTFAYDAEDNLLSQVSYGTVGGVTPSPSVPPAAGYPELARQNSYYDELGRLRRTDRHFFRYVGATLVPLATDGHAGLTTVPPGDPLPAAGDGWVTSLVYRDRLGRVVRTVDDNGHGSETRYDGLGRRIKVLMNASTPFVFDPAHPEEGRNAVDYAYDAGGNLVETIETEYGADRSGGTARLLPAQQHISRFKFDAMGRRIEAKLVGRAGATPVNLTSTTVYDSRGNPIQETDPAGGRTKLSFDGLGRLTRRESGYFWNGSTESIPSNLINSTNPDGKITTRYTYDVNSRMTSLLDDNNRITVFGYDPLNRQVRVTYPDSSTRQAGFDRDSLATSFEQRNVQGYRLAVATTFDGLHRPVLKEVDNSGAPWVAGTGSQAFQYDGLGRITLARDDADTADGWVDSEVSLAYDSLGDVLRDLQIWRDKASGSPATGVNLVNSVYDGAGFRTQVTYPGGRTVSFLPDELNRPERIVDSYTGTTRYDFLGAGRLLNRISPNGTRLTLLSGPTDIVGQGYDGARRIVDFASKLISTGQDVIHYAYGYDPAGNRTFERRIHEPSGSSWKGETFAYDAAYRLTARREGALSASGSLVGSAAASQEYTLDGAGNWRSRKENAATYNQTINSLNQYTQFNGPGGPRTLHYDFLGNLGTETLPSEENRQYGYDFLNRLVSVLGGFYSETHYRYDALGRRISKSVNGARTHYVYDGDRLIEERDAQNTLVASYLFGWAQDEILSRRRTTAGISSDIFYHTNALGSVTAVTDGTGLVVERYRYDAYGQVTFLSPSHTPISSSAVLNNVLFTGRYLDVESGLYYFRARTYHPYLGRFLQRDPLGEAASLNLYTYVFNNPVNRVDPSGMWSPPAGCHSMAAGILQREHDAMNQGWGWSLEQKMKYRAGSFVQHGAAKYGSLEEEAADNEEMATIDRENMEWADKRARVARHNINNQIKESLKLSAANMGNPKEVDLIIAGTNQSFLDEDGFGGERNVTDLDRLANDLIAAGHVVIAVNADDMSTGLGTGFDMNTIQGLAANVLLNSLDAQGNAVPINIVGFSRGTGAAIAVTNELTQIAGVPGQQISTYLVDPFVGDRHGTILNIHVTAWAGRSTLPSFASVAGPLVGFGRKVYQVGGLLPMQPTSAFHGQMDSYDKGVLSFVASSILGRP
jgi:RHS repeat-associated protein